MTYNNKIGLALSVKKWYNKVMKGLFMSYTKKRYDSLIKCESCTGLFEEGWETMIDGRTIFLCDDCYQEINPLEGVNYQEAKLRMWQGRLINISSKNPLVNFESYESSTVEFIYPSPPKIFDNLKNNKPLMFGKWSTNKINSKLICPECGSETIINYPSYATLTLKTKCKYCQKELNYTKLIPIDDQSMYKTDKTNVLISSRNDTVTEKALNLIISRNKSSNLNLGLHMLYLASGFLRWKGSEATDEFRTSPILLLKIDITIDHSKGTFKVNLVNNEIVVNPTLKYLFENYNKNIKITIPEFNEETDTYLSYLIKLQDIIDDMDDIYTTGWEIENRVAIGNFQYQKMRMYYDINENIDKLLHHPIINHMCNGTKEIDIANSIKQDELIDHLENIKDNFSILNYDSSQRWAILAARNGKSFILQGPPGTGKSQTITNIIAECLAVGKSVLFVSEKAVARDVILHNFEQIKYNDNPLSDYCLTLNEQKSRKDGGRVKAMTKREFKDQINMQFTKRITPNTINTDYLTNFDAILEELIAYPECIHQINEVYGQSIYQLISEWTKYRKVRDLPGLVIHEDDKSEIFGISSLIGKYIAFKDIINYDYRLHPFYGFNQMPLNEERKYLFFELLPLVIEEINELLEEGNNFVVKEKINQRLYNYLDYKAWFNNVLSKMIEVPKLSIELINQHDKTNKILDLLKSQKELYLEYFTKKQLLNIDYQDSVLRIDYQNILNRYNTEYRNIFRIFKKQYKLDRITILDCHKQMNAKISFSEMGKVLRLIKRIKELKQDIDDNSLVLTSMLGLLYKQEDTKWDEVVNTIHNYQILLEVIPGDKETFYMMFVNDYEDNHQRWLDRFKKVKNLLNDYYEHVEKLQTYFAESVINFTNGIYNELLNKLNKQRENPSYLDNWLEFLTLDHLPNSNEGFIVINYMLNLRIPFEEMNTTWLKKYYQTIINKLIDKNKDVIGSFSRRQYEQAIKEFDTMDQMHLTTSPRRLYERLYNAKLAMAEEYTKRTPNLITTEDVKGSIRNIIKNKWYYLKKVKPCLMMSPLSVSQFIDSSVEFDVVIFDEASQVLPEDAIGAIVRGKQLIVSGDNQQLPPTNFFQKFIGKGQIEEETEYDEESEKIRPSILNALSFLEPAIELNWHYRSLNEDLITFSNKHFYNNHLITFPSPDQTKEYGITVHLVPDGNYQGGGSNNRTNPNEVRDLLILVYNEICEHPESSIGIVAFNANQAELIKRKIDEMRTIELYREKFNDWELLHPYDDLLIANLETIQGDERDTMFISICYGPDASGKIDLRSFGPIGQDGGEKRLNVAVTRAKKKIIVLSSMKSGELRSALNKACSTNKGINLLADYLEDAEKGIRKVIETSSELASDMHMEKDIYEVIKSYGFDADFQVGISDDKIDIAIKHPTLPNVYVAGIECDNLPYKRYNSVRDRELHRIRILTKSYNWKIYRIWALSWFKDNLNETNALINFIQKAIDEYK